jgi:hypothetical protein
VYLGTLIGQSGRCRHRRAVRHVDYPKANFCALQSLGQSDQ